MAPKPRPIEGELWSIPLDLLKPAPGNRDPGPEAELLELGRSIATLGLLQPLVVARIPGGYRLIAGHRRVAAARLMGMPALPARVRDHGGPTQRAAAAATENLQRRQLTPMEEARAVRSLLTLNPAAGVAGVARNIGRSQPWVRDRLALLDLPADAQALVDQRALTLGEAADLGRQAAAQLATARGTAPAPAPGDVAEPADQAGPAPVPSRLATALANPALQDTGPDPEPTQPQPPRPVRTEPTPPRRPPPARPAAVVLGQRPDRCPPHFTAGHRLATAATARCDHAGHPNLGRLAGLACGACWELAIRLDTATHTREATS